MIRFVSQFIGVITLLFSSFCVSASANKGVDLLTLMLPQVCHFAGEFSQSKHIKALPMPLASNGEFIYSCDLGLIWKTQKPVIESLVFTHQKLHFLVPEKLSVENLDSVQHEFLANLLLGLMAGNTGFIANKFEIKVLEKQGGIIALKLLPKSKLLRQAIDSVVLENQTEKNEIKISIIDNKQQITTIVSTEKRQYANKNDFLEGCVSLSADGCELLKRPVRVSRSGEN